MIGTVALACGVVLLGWASMSGAAVNIIVAPWFDRRRGLAVSWAMNGGSAGGVVIPPPLLFAISRCGLAVGLGAAAGAMFAVPIPIAALTLRPKRCDEHDPAELLCGNEKPARSAEAQEVSEFRLGAVPATRGFLTTSIPFAPALTAQVGFLTLEVAFL